MIGALRPFPLAALLRVFSFISALVHSCCDSHALLWLSETGFGLMVVLSFICLEQGFSFLCEGCGGRNFEGVVLGDY